VSFAFEEAGIPPGVFEPVPQALRSIGVSGSFWASRFILLGFGGFWGYFSSTERRLWALQSFAGDATGWV